MTVHVYFIVLKEGNYDAFGSTLIIGELDVFRKVLFPNYIGDTKINFNDLRSLLLSRDAVVKHKSVNSWVRMVEQNQITYPFSPVVTQHPFLGHNLAELEAKAKIQRREMPF